MKDNITRTKKRIKDTGEVFTPTELVQKMLDDLNIDWNNPPQDKSFLDPTCGNGQFLVEIAIRGIPAQNIYGVDLMPDNIAETRKRLFQVLTEGKTYNQAVEIVKILKNNIRVGDALTFDYENEFI